MPVRSAAWTIFLAVTLLAACETTVSRKAGIAQVLNGYERALRWQSVREAYRFVPPISRPV